MNEKIIEEEEKLLNNNNVKINENNNNKYKKFSSFDIDEKTLPNNTTIIKKIKLIYFQPLRPGSLRASIFGLVCVTLGTGMLPLPYFFKTNGIILTLIIFFICAFSTLWTLKILINLAYENKCYSYNELVGIYFNKNNFMVNYSIVVLLINSLGSIIIWNVLISKFIENIFLFFNIDDKEILIVYTNLIILIFIQIPLATYKTVSEFYIISTVGIIQIIYVVFVLFIEFPNYFKKYYKFYKSKIFLFNFNDKLIEMPNVFFIAFGNHSTILSVIYEIKNKNLNRVIKAGTGTFYFELTIYLIVMFLSFFSTFHHTNEVFLERPKLTYLMMFGQFNMMILMICNISLYYYMLIPLLELFFNNNKPFQRFKNFYISSIILTILTFISFYIKKIINIFSFIGSSAQISLIFILPISLYLKANSQKISKIKKFIYILIEGIFSFLGMVCFLYLLIYKL
jgi:amino acid permease